MSQRLTYRLRYDEHHLDRWIDLRCALATKKVTITRAIKDALNGRAGSTIACMDSNCAMRSASLFPHKVYLAVFTASSAYIVDKLDHGGQPSHCVWYRHNDSEAIGIHDNVSPKEIIRLGLAETTITLRPPKRWLNRKQVRNQTTKPHPAAPGPKKEVLPTGARKRALAAGILVLP